ncbi:MAG TPA: hypothetical protein DEQ74_02955 [Wolbachia sp.]|jgi:hypothetical protein|nr:hypothetical protein [Wolbachia sp.]
MPSYIRNNTKKEILTAVSMLMAAGLGGAIDGVATDYAISHFLDLSPIVRGGIIGIGLSGPLLTAFSLAQNFIAGSGICTQNIIKDVVESSIAFIIGADMVAFGVTSPAVIGTVAGLTFFSLELLYHKVTPSSSMVVESTNEHQNISQNVPAF